ncbi:MAG: hypothetical protein MPK03_00105, partial [Alphaproteobacteria bacterium]|nr:hypothetical protein [Alphaproteobacteria bacterium]
MMRNGAELSSAGIVTFAGKESMRSSVPSAVVSSATTRSKVRARSSLRLELLFVLTDRCRRFAPAETSAAGGFSRMAAAAAGGRGEAGLAPANEGETRLCREPAGVSRVGW